MRICSREAYKINRVYTSVVRFRDFLKKKHLRCWAAFLLAATSVPSYAQKSEPLTEQAQTIAQYENLVRSGFPLQHEDSILIAFGQLKHLFGNLPNIPVPYGKCATELAFEANRISGSTELKQSVLFSAAATSDSIKSPSGMFTIHFSKTGPGSVSQEYLDSIAKYADEALELEIVELGYPRPPSSFPGDSTWHITLSDLGTSGVYGFTQATDATPISHSPSGLPRFRTSSTIDNDFSESSYPTHGFDAARITVFHEFHHVIQYGSFGTGQDDVNFREMTSVWMEMRSTPQVKDYLQYIGEYLAHFDQSFDHVQGFGYNECIWMQYLEKKFGDEIIKMVWQFYSSTNSDFATAFDSVLAIHGTNFCTEYNRFGTQVYYTGRRFSGKSIFPDAALFPSDSLKLKILQTTVPFTINSFLPISLAICICGYGADTSVITLSRNTDRRFVSRATIISKDISTFSTTFDFPLTFCDSLSIFIPVVTKVFPNPFVINSLTNELNILASTNNYPPISVECNIYSASNSLVRHLSAAEVSEQSSAAEPVGGSWYLQWDGLDDLGRLVPTGVYFYSIRTDGVRDNGKFVLIRRN